MGAKQPSPPERVQFSFKQLTASATELNAASDELCEVVSALNAALQQLKVGLAAWVTITAGNDASGGYYWIRELGYARVGKKWGIALRDRSGYEHADTDEDCEVWLFEDAPRWLRIEAVGKIPDLIEHLVKQAESTTKRLRAKTAEARALLDVISAEQAGW